MVWRRLLQYPIQAMFVALVVVYLAGALVVGGIAWRTFRQLERADAGLDYRAELHRSNALLQRLVAEQLVGHQRPDPADLAELRSEVSALRAWQPDPSPGVNRARLAEVAELLAEPDVQGAQLRMAAGLLDALVNDEVAARRELGSRLRAEARSEIETATGLFLALVVLALGGTWMVQRRFLRPLGHLRAMFSKLGAGDFTPLAAERLDPVLAPLFENYNHLVTRLEHLEKEHRSRAAHLEQEVRSAAEALLEQQRTLARAERLAAVGEMAASLAHELRNPLAGIQMNLVNLRRDLADPQLTARLNLAIAEVERLSRLLNHQLSEARHLPEEPSPLHLNSLVEELLALLRYQVPPHVRLEAQVQDDLECRLPRDRLRQALLNLVLNSVHALGDTPGSVRLGARREGGHLVLMVTDDGPGFPPELLKPGGQAFVTRRVGGTGLGLAMVRRLAADLDGDLVLENLEPRGARVRLTLRSDA